MFWRVYVLKTLSGWFINSEIKMIYIILVQFSYFFCLMESHLNKYIGRFGSLHFVKSLLKGKSNKNVDFF